MNKKVLVLQTFLSITLGSLVSCGNKTNDNPPINEVIKVESVKLTCDKESIYIDEVANLNVEINPSDAKDKTYRFEVNPINSCEIKDNTVFPKVTGNIEISVITNDGNYKDTISLLLNSSEFSNS